MRLVANTNLWIGHVGDVRDLQQVHEHGIVALIDLAINEPIPVVPRDIVYLRFPLVDNEGNPVWVIRAAVDTLARLIRDNRPTMVYCANGMSRSVAIAGAALAQAHQITPQAGLETVGSDGPADVSTSLWAEILGSL